ncbi:MAG: ATP synthase subunit C [Candidatus Brocadiia bacterium]
MLSRKRSCQILILVGLVLGAACWFGPASAIAGEAETPEKETVVEQQNPTSLHLAWAIAVAVGLPCLGAAYAVGRIGSAALGAASENPDLLTRSLLFVALAEGIAIYGLLIGVLLWMRL